MVGPVVRCRQCRRETLNPRFCSRQCVRDWVVANSKKGASNMPSRWQEWFRIRLRRSGLLP